MLYRITLSLARSREFPSGNPQCRYELCIPLTPDSRLDYVAWIGERSRTSVRRIWSRHQEQHGRLKHNIFGWFTTFGYGVRAEDAIFEGEQDRFLVGDRIQIDEPDGQVRIYKVVKVEPEPSPGRD